MDVYKLSRSWFDFAFENTDMIAPIHSAIYFFAIEQCNRLGWKEKFGFPSSLAMEAIGVRSYNTYSKALNELVDWGFIIMIKKSTNQHTSNIIGLSKFNEPRVKANVKALDKAIVKQGTKQGESNYSIDIPIYNNTNLQNNNNTPEIIFDYETGIKPVDDFHAAQIKTIRQHYDEFMTKDSTQKELMAMDKKLSTRQIEVGCMGFVQSLITKGHTMEDIYPKFKEHFRNWFNKYGANNLKEVPKERIEAEFRKFKKYEYAQ